MATAPCVLVIVTKGSSRLRVSDRHRGRRQLWWTGWGDVGLGIAPLANGVEVSNGVSDGARRCRTADAIFVQMEADPVCTPVRLRYERGGAVALRVLHHKEAKVAHPATPRSQARRGIQ